MAPDPDFDPTDDRVNYAPSAAAFHQAGHFLQPNGRQGTPDGDDTIPRFRGSSPTRSEQEWREHPQQPIPARRSEDDSRSRQQSRSASGQLRMCKKCGEPLTAQFVRALEGTFHIDCFTCRDCGQIVASKFFPADEENSDGLYPLCETDYFRRLGMLCYQCGGALRGSYITALDRKYHVEHFTCSVCPTVFGAQDSYYEHEGKVYCHYHYSTQFAQRCNGCRTPILKQFVEILRNGQNQHWHPECYMIHKFWNVRLACNPTSNSSGNPDQDQVTGQSPARSTYVPDEGEQMEEKMFKIWSVLSAYEESSAACISDMLLHVSNGAYADGILVAKRFIWHIETLFSATDSLDTYVHDLNGTNLTYSREAKLLCKKVVAFFSLISKAQDASVGKLGVTSDLLSLVTGLAHYLKLLIRICLQGALRIERDAKSAECIYQFLDVLSLLDVPQPDGDLLNLRSGLSGLATKGADHCVSCKKSLEDECAKNGDSRWHLGCVKCSRCGRELGRALEDARYNAFDSKVYCSDCTGISSEGTVLFEHVTKLQQFVFLLRVAMDRLLDKLQLAGKLSNPQNQLQSQSADEAEPNSHNHLQPQSSGGIGAGTGSGARSKSMSDDRRESTYEITRDEITKLRNTRLDRSLSSSVRKTRMYSMTDRPEGRTMRPVSSGADDKKGGGEGVGGIGLLHIVEDVGLRQPTSTDMMFSHPDGLTLDDIPRIVAAEQSREQYNKPGRQYWAKGVMPEHGSPAAGGAEWNGHQRTPSEGRDVDMINGGAAGADSLRPRAGRRFFSELSSLEYFAVRHLAVLTMQPMVESDFTQEELLGFIEQRKQATFWKNLGKAFGKASSKKKGVFGVPLEVILERDGADSTDGVGPGTLRVPAIVDNIIGCMRKMDLSVEGMFRKNGNIKKLGELIERIDRDGCDNVNFMEQPVVQIAALLKRYLRELPDPLMTHKLYKLWLAAARIPDEDRRRHCLHLACCLLPKCHRDLLEVLFSFLKWTGSFHHVDDDSGSRMDIHNIAIVIAPNVLYNNTKSPALDNEPILAIDAVEQVLLYIEEMCMVPHNMDMLLGDPALFSGNGEMTTKEILKRFNEVHVQRPQAPYLANVRDAYSNRHDVSTRPPARRIETDPALWKQETILRPVTQDQLPSPRPYSVSGPSVGSVPGLKSPPMPPRRKGFQFEEESDSEVQQQQQKEQEVGGRRDWRQSGWGRQNGAMGVTGNMI